MNTYKANDVVNISDVKAGFQFLGGDGVVYTVTETDRAILTDAQGEVTYVTVTDGTKTYELFLNQLVTEVAA